MTQDFSANIPSNVGDDWVVYVNNLNNPTGINGYRDGNTWYNTGVEMADPRTLLKLHQELLLC